MTEPPENRCLACGEIITREPEWRSPNTNMTEREFSRVARLEITEWFSLVMLDYWYSKNACMDAADDLLDFIESKGLKIDMRDE